MKQGMHNEKYSAKDSGGIEKEQKRLNEYKEYRNEVDTSLSQFNFIQGNTEWQKVIEEARTLTKETTGRKVRENTVCLNSIIETVPKSWGRENVIDYFDLQDQMIRDLLKQQGVEDKWMLTSIIHFDETNPHRTFTFVPVKDGKLQNKNIVNQYFLHQLADRGWEVYKAFEADHDYLEKLDQPEFGAAAEHLSELEYKIEQKKEELENAEKKLKNYNDKIKDKTENLDKVSQQLEEAEGKVNTLEARKTSLESEIKELNDVSDFLENDKDITIKIEDMVIPEKKSVFGKIESPKRTGVFIENMTKDQFKALTLRAKVGEKIESMVKSAQNMVDQMKRKYSELVNQVKKLLDQKESLAPLKKEVEDLEKARDILYETLQNKVDISRFHEYHSLNIFTEEHKKSVSKLNKGELLALYNDGSIKIVNKNPKGGYDYQILDDKQKGLCKIGWLEEDERVRVPRSLLNELIEARDRAKPISNRLENYIDQQTHVHRVIEEPKKKKKMLNQDKSDR